jgi:hypothetical protein
VYQRGVRLDGGDDVEDVGFFGPEHLLWIGVDARDAELPGELVGLLLGAVVNGGDLDAGQLAPAGDLVGGPEAGAGDGNAYGLFRRTVQAWLLV